MPHATHVTASLLLSPVNHVTRPGIFTVMPSRRKRRLRYVSVLYYAANDDYPENVFEIHRNLRIESIIYSTCCLAVALVIIYSVFRLFISFSSYPRKDSNRIDKIPRQSIGGGKLLKLIAGFCTLLIMSAIRLSRRCRTMLGKCN